MNEIFVDGVNVAECEFQSDCIEYKDISYLKIMPICAIYELSIACHHTVNRCKYYKLYEQLKRLEAENEKLKKHLKQWQKFLSKGYCECEFSKNLVQENNQLKKELYNQNILDKEIESLSNEEKYKQALEDIRELGKKTGSMKLIEIIDEVLNENT